MASPVMPAATIFSSNARSIFILNFGGRPGPPDPPPLSPVRFVRRSVGMCFGLRLGYMTAHLSSRPWAAGLNAWIIAAGSGGARPYARGCYAAAYRAGARAPGADWGAAGISAPGRDSHLANWHMQDRTTQARARLLQTRARLLQPIARAARRPCLALSRR